MKRLNPFVTTPLRGLIWGCAAASISLTPASRAAEPPIDLTAVVRPFVERHELAGAVMLVGSRDRDLDIKTVGFADVEQHKPMPPDALFWIASQMEIDTRRGLFTIWMVQHDGFPGDGGHALETFRKAAYQKFGSNNAGGN